MAPGISSSSAYCSRWRSRRLVAPSAGSSWTTGPAAPAVATASSWKRAPGRARARSPSQTRGRGPPRSGSSPDPFTINGIRNPGRAPMRFGARPTPFRQRKPFRKGGPRTRRAKRRGGNRLSRAQGWGRPFGIDDYAEPTSTAMPWMRERLAGKAVCELRPRRVRRCAALLPAAWRALNAVVARQLLGGPRPSRRRGSP